MQVFKRRTALILFSPSVSTWINYLNLHSYLYLIHYSVRVQNVRALKNVMKCKNVRKWWKMAIFLNTNVMSVAFYVKKIIQFTIILNQTRMALSVHTSTKSKLNWACPMSNSIALYHNPKVLNHSLSSPDLGFTSTVLTHRQQPS